MPHKPKDSARARTPQLAPARTVLVRKIHDHEEAERTLAAAGFALHRQIAERERLEEERPDEERALREVHATFESAFANAPIGMALVDMKGRWLQVNDALCRITGYPRESLKATTLPAITHPDDIDLDTRFLRELLRGQIPNYQIEKRYRHAWGHYFWVLLTVSLVRDENGEPLHVISQVQDISERKELAGRLEHLVDRDFLTGLFNRRRFEQELAKEVDRISRYGGTGALLLLDLDHFKDVNDAFGHKAGDDLLKGVAGALKHRMRQTDVLARVGGDEFAVLLPQTDAEEAQFVADAIVKTVGQHVAMLGEQSIRATASVGIALFDGMDAIEVFAVADLAMYEAKGAGRNRVSIYRRGDRSRERISARLAEAERIRKALAEDRFLLYGQPILDLKEKEVCQYELLLRLRTDEDAEPLPPSSFLYVAERFGLIREIDAWVALQAIGLIAKHARAGRRLVLHVNLSGKSIGDSTVAGVIEDALAKSGIDPALLIFELTETAAIANIEEAKAFAHRLRARGCRFALDDFGAGFGSFYYLKTLPFDFFKIDGDFIRGLVASPMDQLVVGAIVGIARGMGKKTIAEFVADEETARLLEKSGVDFAQGYYIGRPQPLTEILPAV
ncbi:MAG TPA: EAL domain-containing protein [Planctomycetota bacterium]|jgi:diguanylate cyclase (GGDEF)-like protein/PAS domain S-box-containing protein|nr:EAL domain-containing protein [Planctomycetota bacterium]